MSALPYSISDWVAAHEGEEEPRTPQYEEKVPDVSRFDCLAGPEQDNPAIIEKLPAESVDTRRSAEGNGTCGANDYRARGRQGALEIFDRCSEQGRKSRELCSHGHRGGVISTLFRTSVGTS
jgi:hypothetical protein